MGEVGIPPDNSYNANKIRLPAPVPVDARVRQSRDRLDRREGRRLVGGRHPLHAKGRGQPEEMIKRTQAALHGQASKAFEDGRYRARTSDLLLVRRARRLPSVAACDASPANPQIQPRLWHGLLPPAASIVLPEAGLKMVGRARCPWRRNRETGSSRSSHRQG